MNRILPLSLAIAFACPAAHAEFGPHAARGADPAWLPVGMPAGGCPIFADGFDEEGAGSPIEYLTLGGYTIRIDRHTITITDPLGTNTIQHWGDPHENLNGKHIKDWGGEPEWDGARRSLVLGDGAKLTLEALGPHGVVMYTSIYDGNENLQVDNCRNAIEHHGFDAVDGALRDAWQHDGETAGFDTDPASGIARYSNFYNQGEAFDVVELETPLGTTGGFANPNQVNDLYDDPRLGHT